MLNLLVGNGVNIQFGGTDYTNKNIIIRAIKKTREEKINPDLYGIEILQFFELCFKELPAIINGYYDTLAVTSYEKSSLKHFKNRYSKHYRSLEIYDIGFEDHFLIFELFCRKNKISNPNLYDFRGLLKRFFLDSIYNNGNIQRLHTSFPQKFKDFINQFDKVFTTNYDNNIETFSGKSIGYLHGAFHILDDVYNPDSFRNKLSDIPSSVTPVVKGFEYLFSNALIDFSGFGKDYSMNAPSRTNIALKKFVEGMKKDESLRKEILTWKNSENIALRNLGEAIILKSEYSELEVSEYYTLKEFKNIRGSLSIIGLSPNNDNHLFEIINNNQNIDSINYFFHSEEEGRKIKAILKLKKEFQILDVSKLWKDLSS